MNIKFFLRKIENFFIKKQFNYPKTIVDFINNNKNLLLLQSQFDNKKLNQTGLLSLKPKIFVCNVDEKSVKNGNSYTKNFIEKFGTENTLIISADIENQLNQLDVNEKKNYMNIIGLKE